MPGVKTHLPTTTENPLKKSRAFSFEQLYHFNNLCMNKSFLRKRVRSLEVDLATAQKHIKELERWREEMESRMAENFDQVYKRFDKNDQRHFAFVKRTEDSEKEINDRITNNDAQIANI